MRIPAACNGLVGLKTSRGLGPYGPQTGEVMFGMVTQGVVSRTVRDSAGLLDAIIAPDPGAGYQAALPPTPFTEIIKQRPGTLRIGYSWSSAINDTRTPRRSPPSSRPWRCSAELGHQVEAVTPPHDDEALARDFLTIWFAQLHGQVADVKRRLGARDSDFEADTLASAELGRAAGWCRCCGRWRTSTTTSAPWPASTRPTTSSSPRPSPSRPSRWATPTSPDRLQKAARAVAKVRAGKLLSASGILDQLISDNIGWVPYTQLANLTGRPAISVPLHWTQQGLPLGVQLVGRLGADGLLLQLAAQLEEAQPWFHRYAELDPGLMP